MSNGSHITDYPKVSIVTPSYNQGRFIEDTLLSVKNQDYPNIEHIVVDGGSTDDTLEILRKYENEYNLKWISEPDEGQSDAVNTGFKKVKGEIVGWLNSDDAYLSIHTISDVVQFFKNHHRAKVVCGDTLIIDGGNRVICMCPVLPFLSYSLLKKGNFISQPSTLFRREIIDNYHLDKELHYAMDYDFWLNIGKDHRFYHMPKVISCFRWHEESKSISQYPMMKDEATIVRQRHYHALERLNRPNPLLSILFYSLHVIALPQALKLYTRSDFAFNVKLPPMHKIIAKQLLLENVLRKIGISRFVRLMLKRIF